MKYWGLFILIALVALGCIDPFNPSDTSTSSTYLVVNGFLNTSDTTTIVLSRTQSLSSTESPESVTGATVQVIGSLGTTYTLTEQSSGTYVLLPMTFSSDEAFKLAIATPDGKQYESDEVAIKNSPDIDSISFLPDKDNGIMRFTVTTHDPNNSTWFYRWKTEETFQYNAAYYSSLVVQNNEFVSRTTSLYTCWRTDLSGTILINTSAKYTKDQIENNVVTTIDNSSPKLLIKYSLLVKQYALTQDAYEYWDQLAKTTETTGGLFDPLPSTVTGNIHCTTDSDELVFGYFSAGAVATLRRTFVPSDFNGWYPGSYLTCATTPDTLERDDALGVTDAYQLIIGSSDEEPSPLYYYVVPPSCADCRTYGGSITKPSWF
ncbi:MAG: DUF4249 domain-containing protein [Siphonobacter sp.]